MNQISTNLNDSFLDKNFCIFKKYKPIKKIGKGNFGIIYSIIRLKDKKVFAMKIEKKNGLLKTIETEAHYLILLQGLGIPKFISFGKTKEYNILIETLLDKSLYNIFFQNKKKCSITDACLIGIQLLDRLEWIHSKNIVYRDVKPEHFLIGINDPNVIYVVDFGLCKKYRSSRTGKHILLKLTGKFNGTLKYASPNVVRGKESSRRDDLISLGYMLIFLIKRDLPWPNSIRELNEHNYTKLLYLKDTDGCGKLLKNLPDEFVEYIKYTKALKFEQQPDYSYLRFLFNKYLFNKSFNIKNISLSWIAEKNKKLLENRKNIININYRPNIRIINNFNKEKIKKINKAKSSSFTDYKNNSNRLTNFNNEKEQTNIRDDKILENPYLRERKINTNININKNKLRNFFNIKKNNNLGNTTRIKKNVKIDMYLFHDDINKKNNDIINSNNNLQFNTINHSFFNKSYNKKNNINIKDSIKKIIRQTPKNNYNDGNDFSDYISDIPFSNTSRTNEINKLNNRNTYTLPNKHKVKYSNDLIYKSPLLNKNILNLETNQLFINNFIANRTINNRTLNYRSINNKLKNRSINYNTINLRIINNKINNFRSISQNINQTKSNNINTNNNNIYHNTINNYNINNRRLNSDNIELLDIITNLKNSSNSYIN